ncbi:hypothetical protein BH24ACT5_BH24ACT5_15990 [soil metagenome]
MRLPRLAVVRLPRLAVVTLVALAAVVSAPAPGHADNDSGSSADEGRDLTTVGTAPADTRPPQANASTLLTASASRPLIDGFVYDDRVLTGTASEVCAGRLLRGTGWTYTELVQRFGGSPGSMYVCRERWDEGNDPDCNGTVVNPATSPNFTSTCWSNHARGRALDILVGTVAGGGYNRARGQAIVNWLLASDSNGTVNYNARRLGVQQILFDNRCWNSDGDRGIASWAAVRSCGIGHENHLHIDMTIAGADGNVSYWGATPVPMPPTPDTQVFWDWNASWRQAVSWWNLQTTDEEGLNYPAGYDTAIVGDWDSNGGQGEVFLWNKSTGDYVIQDWNDGDSLQARMGVLRANGVVAGEWDGDGEFDDMFFWNNDGYWTVWTWNNYEPTFRTRGYFSAGNDDYIAGDFDGDGRTNDMFIWDHDTGKYNVFTWQSFRGTYRRRGQFPAAYDELIVGDWSAGGDLDESLLWDRQTGNWQLMSWRNFLPFVANQGRWSVQYDVAAPGDYDSDGRVDDLYLYDRHAGYWALVSFQRNVQRTRLTGRWETGFEAVSVGPFNE